MNAKMDSDDRFKKPFIELTDQIKKDGSVPLEMTDFDYLPTLRCNLKCKHCRQADVRPDKEWAEIKDEMNMNEIKHAWNRIPVEGKIVKINGGEPFVKHEIWDIFQYFKDRGAYNIVATNAFIFDKQKNIDRLKQYGLIEITTSFDGMGWKHDLVRGRKGLFNTMTNFVKEMTSDHKVLLESCIQNDNVRDLPKMLKLKKKLEAYKIRFQLPVFTTSGEIKRGSQEIGEALRYEAQVVPEGKFDFSFRTLMKNYNKMVLTEEEFDMHPQFFDAMPEAAYNRETRKDYNLLCTYMFRNKIDPNGDVRFCPYIIKSFGNIKEEKLENIWNSADFRSFRKKVATNNLLESCENCPHTRIYSMK